MLKLLVILFITKLYVRVSIYQIKQHFNDKGSISNKILLAEKEKD